MKTTDRHNRDWTARAACRGLDVNTFYPVAVGRAATPYVEKARAVCRPCPVKIQCLREALETKDAYGIRAGLTPEQRAAVIRQEVAR